MIYLSLDNKVCHKCKENKPKTEFHVSRNRKDGVQSCCKSCFSKRAKIRLKQPGERARANAAVNKSRRLKHYGVTQEQYDSMFTSQKGSCAGCLVHQTELKKSLAVDHCHLTGKVRGLLCDNCNKSLGLLDDSTETLKRLENYLVNS